MNKCTSILIATVVAVMSGCAEFPEVLSARVILANESGGQRPAVPENLQPVFKVVPGAIAGATRRSPAVPIAPFGADEIRYKLAQFENSASQMAEPQSDDSRERGIMVTPTDTRITRVGTLGLTTAGQTKGGAFLRGYPGDPLILIYVNQPCEISGEVEMAGNRYVFDVAFGRKGFHWILTTSDYRFVNPGKVDEVVFRLRE